MRKIIQWSKRGAVWVGCVAASFLIILGADGPSQFEQANRLYEQGKYREAISVYQNVIKTGANSAGVLFNLGNACFKAGNLGQALFYYRRAELLAPRDPDIQANLRFTRDQVSGTSSIQRAAWKRLIGYFTLNELTIGVAILFWIWMISLALLRYRPALMTSLRSFAVITGCLFAALLIILLLSFSHRRDRNAIVITRQVTVHLGPLPESQTAFTASDGTELKVHDERENWIQVSDRSNRSGWVQAERVMLFPK
jgi:tetratricopeptide (TPR) repeat protein